MSALAAAATALVLAGAPPAVTPMVTRDSLSLPARCGPREVTETLFQTALSDPRLERLEVEVRPSKTRGHVSIRYFTSHEPRSIWSGTMEVECRSGPRTLRETAQHPDCPGPCPLPASTLFCPSSPAGVVAVACSRAGQSPRAQEIAPGFDVGRAGVPLPPRCRPGAARRLVTRALRAFNLGAARAFAQSFTPGANMQPYTGSTQVPNLSGRYEIERFVNLRSARKDGWTGLRLLSPQGPVGLPREAVYGLSLHVSSNGSFLADGGAKLVLDCRTGLLSRWVGPSFAAPG